MTRGRNDCVTPRGASVSWRRGLALAWLILFCAWFYSFGLPNNRPAERWMVWAALPFDLLDLIDPPLEANALPWSWLNLGQRLPFLGVAVIVWPSAIAVGRLELRGLRMCACFDRMERMFFAGCLGLATLSLVTLGFGVMGIVNRWPLVVLFLVAGGLELWLTRNDLAHLAASGNSSSLADPSHGGGEGAGVWVPRAAVAVLIPVMFCLMLGAMSPQTDFDVLEYHLGGPKEWYLQGRISRLPHNVYTSFPFLTEMLLLSGMVLYGDWEWGALAGQAVIAGFAPLTAIGLLAAGRRWFSNSVGWVAALAWLTTPWAYRISIIAYAEGGLACYLFAALAVALRIVWDQDAKIGPDREPVRAGLETGAAAHWLRQAGLPVLCGLLAGSAMACKYTGLVSAVVPIGLLLAGNAARTASGSARVARLLAVLAAYSAGVLIAAGPWLLKNTLETGNPVFPLAYPVFNGDGRDAEMDAQWRRGHSRHYDRPIDRLWDLPVKLTDVVANNDWHSALMFGLAPIAILASWRRKVWCLWAMIGWQFLSWFLLTHHIDRFYVPMFPIVALVAGCGAGFLLSFPAGRWCGGLVIAASILFNAWIMQNLGGFNAGRLDLPAAADQVISPPLRWLNQEFAAGRFPADFKVLCVGEAALFRAKFPYVYNTVFDRSRFEQWFALRSESGEFRLQPANRICETLRQRGITHVLVNWSEILRYREPGSYGYTDFAHPDWFARLTAAGVLDNPLPLPEQASIVPVNETKRRQAAAWAPQLLLSVADRPALRAVQVYPVRR